MLFQLQIDFRFPKPKKGKMLKKNEAKRIMLNVNEEPVFVLFQRTP